MSASMAEGMIEVLSAHQGTYVAEDPDGYQWCIRCGGCEKALQGGYGNTAWVEREALLAAHQAEVLAANGYGKLEDAWDGGRRAGYDAGSRWARTGEDKDTPNPYRRPE